MTSSAPARVVTGRAPHHRTDHLEPLMPNTTPADQLRAAATLLRDKATAAIHEGRTTWSTGHTLGSRSPVVVDDPDQPSVLIETYAARLERVNSYLALVDPALGLALADWLGRAAVEYDATVRGAAGVWSEPGDERERDAWVERQTNQHALAVARQLLGTGAGEAAPPAPLAEVWTVWREDEPIYAHYTTEGDARQGTIDCWQDDEPVCPDYSWRKDGPRLELVVGGEHAGVYASRHRVYGTPPAPADRYRSAWSSARHRAAVLSAELTRRAPLLGEYAAENTRLLTQAVKAATTITRLRAERAELNRQLDCLRGDMRNMESCLREQDAEFERIRRAASEAAPPAPADRAAILTEAAEVAAAHQSDCQNCAVELEVADHLRRLAGEAAAGVQQPTESDTELTATLVINRSDSYCDRCGKPTLPQRTHHTDISGWAPKPGGGCGARFTATRSDYRGITPNNLRDVRPDLPVATPPAAPAVPEEPTP
ncbi:hypothetical protein [Streptomyces sp. NPDC091649]|uniref:hypothetical protein n=1 Tax=Streptomyces sp. NPDC091649 TaxID=3366004 RepID=UPI0038136B2D